MVNWDTQNRGQNRENEDEYYDESDWDGKSCMDHHALPGRGIRDIEDLTILSGLQERSSEQASPSDEP